MRLLSFVIPCYRSALTIGQVIDEIDRVVGERPEFDYEVIAVNDCSPDHVLQVLKELALTRPKLRVVSLARNMGKHAAVLAGYRFVRGEIVVNLDDDLQSPTPELWRLLEPLLSGEFDAVTASYPTSVQAWWKQLGSRLNKLMADLLLSKPRHVRFHNFNALQRFVAAEVVRYRHPYPYIEGLVLRVTTNIASVEMAGRARGDDLPTGFTLRKSVSLFVNGLTAFSVTPLRVATIAGFCFALIGFIGLAITVVKKLLLPEVPAGFTSLMSVLLFTNGFTMLSLGLLGEYLGRVYICINDSPQYVIRETINVPAEELRGPDNQTIRISCTTEPCTSVSR
ncbi:MAG: glycosyltransferase [Planctomycetota bacterium]